MSVIVDVTEKPWWRNLEKLSNLAKIGTFLVALVSVSVGGWYYRSAVRQTVYGQITEKENRLYTALAESWDLLYVELPPGDDHLPVKLRADKLLRAIQEGYVARAVPDAARRSEEIAELEWDDVTQIDPAIYAYSEWKKQGMHGIRKAYLVADMMLYLVFDVYDAHANGHLDDETWQTYAAYITDVGDHPLFLSAVAYGRRVGYLTKDFCTELKERLSRRSRQQQAVAAIYRDMMSDSDWADGCRAGKRHDDGRLAGPSPLSRPADRRKPAETSVDAAADSISVR